MSHSVKVSLIMTEKPKASPLYTMHRELLYETTFCLIQFLLYFYLKLLNFFFHPLKISVTFLQNWSSEVVVHAVFCWCGDTCFLLMSSFFLLETLSPPFVPVFFSVEKKGYSRLEAQEFAIRNAGYPLRCITPVFVITAVLHMMPSLTETWPLRSSADHFRTKLMRSELTGSWSSWSVWIIKT